MTLTTMTVLEQTVPEWFDLRSTNGHCLEGVATVPVPGAAEDFNIYLDITLSDSAVSAKEACVSAVLPRSCPERHINPDATFCLGYGAGLNLTTVDEAIVWWEVLKQYLLLQRTASKTRSWPGHFIAHGAAGSHHIQARKVAQDLGILDDYDDAVLGGSHWSSDGTVRLSRDRLRLVNGRSGCPMGCVGRRGKPRLRRECCHKESVLTLVQSEMRRQGETKRFWHELRVGGRVCCGTLRECPLR